MTCNVLSGTLSLYTTNIISHFLVLVKVMVNVVCHIMNKHNSSEGTVCLEGQLEQRNKHVAKEYVTM